MIHPFIFLLKLLTEAGKRGERLIDHLTSLRMEILVKSCQNVMLSKQ